MIRSEQVPHTKNQGRSTFQQLLFRIRTPIQHVHDIGKADPDPTLWQPSEVVVRHIARVWALYGHTTRCAPCLLQALGWA